uniref:Uncharacterized protein n=1 Tax=Romanomermis culicivorax TaxID=13658 RepID=A0A915HK90_ROMCU
MYSSLINGAPCSILTMSMVIRDPATEEHILSCDMTLSEKEMVGTEKFPLCQAEASLWNVASTWRQKHPKCLSYKVVLESNNSRCKHDNSKISNMQIRFPLDEFRGVLPDLADFNQAFLEQRGKISGSFRENFNAFNKGWPRKTLEMTYSNISIVSMENVGTP